MTEHKYQVGESVIVQISRCSCNGGGYDTSQRTIQKIVTLPNGAAMYYITSDRAVPESNIVGKA